MFSLVVFVIFAVTAINAGFHRAHHMHHSYTTDMNGFHNFGHHQYSKHHLHNHFRPQPPYEPFQPPFPPHNYQPGSMPFGMPSLDPYTVPNYSNMMPFNPSIFPNNMPFNLNPANPILFPPIFTNPYNLGGNYPFNPFNTPNSNNPFNGNIPSNTQNIGYDQTYNPLYNPVNNPVQNPVNLPGNPFLNSQSNFNTNNLTPPLDANTVFDNQNNSNDAAENVFNDGNQPRNVTTPASTSNGYEGNINFK